MSVASHNRGRDPKSQRRKANARKSQNRNSRRPAFEALEQRQVLSAMGWGAAWGTVSGIIWNDADGDGVRDRAEARQANWLVFADANGNGQYDRGEAAAYSGRDGSYRLSVTPGTYTIMENPVAGWRTTTPASGAYSVTVRAWRAATTVNFGNQRAAGTVSGTVWNDADGDGAPETGEAGLAGWQVYADANNNRRYDAGEVATTTKSDGTYQLSVAPGSYTIRETVPTGWQVTAPSNGSYAVTIAAGQSVTSQDFGNCAAVETPATGAFDIELNLTGMTASEQAIARQAAARWESVIVGDLPDMRSGGRTIDDIVITIGLQSIDGTGNIIGEGGPDALRYGSNLPYSGSIIIDQADAAQMESTGLLLDVLTHEIGHVLGLGTIWETKGLLTGTRTTNPLFTGTQATAAYNSLFGTSARGVPVEATGGAGTALAHWRESVFGNELMVGTIHYGGMALSTVTVASMADLGYQVNMAAAEAYTPPGTTSSALVLPSGWSSRSPGSMTSAPATSAAITTGDAVLAAGVDAATNNAVAIPSAVPTRGRSPWHETLTAVDRVFQAIDRWLEAV